MAREHNPVKGQWYDNLEDDDSFQVLSIDEDAELIEIQYVDGDIEEIDYETWHELDLELTVQPEGWTGSEEEDEDDDDDWDDDDDEDDDDDDDWDDDDEDDDDDDDGRYGDRDDY